MSRPQGSTNKPKNEVQINVLKCKKCKFVLRTCIPLDRIAVGHNCKDYQ